MYGSALFTSGVIGPLAPPGQAKLQTHPCVAQHKIPTGFSLCNVNPAGVAMCLQRGVCVV